MVMGMGNISGPGMALVDLFRRHNRRAAEISHELREAA
jgi:hypothetical protein